jgi:hypothetical protein
MSGKPLWRSRQTLLTKHNPKDIKYPPALNLFDFGWDRLQRYTEVEQEMSDSTGFCGKILSL